jgi:dTDP-4-dehydrorhamnose reductase
VAITGAGGQLGVELVRVFSTLGDNVLGLQRPYFDITRPPDMADLVDFRPEVVINAAAWTDVDGCARDPSRATLINGEAAGSIAAAAEKTAAIAVQISTNEVFDGEREEPYTEEDVPRPGNAYGESKLAGERAVRAATDRHVIVRTAWLYGGGVSFPAKIRAAAERARNEDRPLKVVADEFGNPTPADALAERIADLISMWQEHATPHVIHLAGEPPTTRYDWARRILGDSVTIEPIRQEDYPRPSRPPRKAVLATSLAVSLGVKPIMWQDDPG